jgi:hypothetical protein
MLVTRVDSKGNMTSIWREPKPCKLTKNGGYIDIWLTYNNEKIFIAIPIEHLKSAINLKDQGDSIESYETHDERIEDEKKRTNNI